MDHHEAASIFPMDESTISDLANDIEKNGQLVPIEVVGGRILDGRRRYAACLEVNVEPKICEVNPVDPIAYVLSLNLHRRHLTESQRAMVGARARAVYDREAKKRMSDGGKSAGKGRPQQGVAHFPPPKKSKARDQAGKAVNVSGRSISKASRVLNKVNMNLQCRI